MGLRENEQTDMEPLVEIAGTLERIVYENAETGFFVGKLAMDELTEPICFVGQLMAVAAGEKLRLRGRWVEDRKWGRQLRVESFDTLTPASAKGIEVYLGSGLIDGIGPQYAKRLVTAFGVDTLRIIEEEPERLREVPGIGKKRAARIGESLTAQKSLQSIMVFLQGHGITPAQAVRIHKAYGDSSAAVLRENPYRLARDIDGIGFKSADAIAAKMGIAKDSPQRLDAGLQFVLQEACGEGHVFLPDTELLAQAAERLGVASATLEAPLHSLIERRGVIREEDAIFLPSMHGAERGCAELLKRLLRTPFDPVSIQIENALAWVEKNHKIQLSEEQRDAIREAIRAKVMVITGGPGTGKTTVINSLLSIFERKGISFLLAAPTGRAAKRMEAATDRPASTIHRLLEFSPRTGSFTRNEGNPIVTDMIVIDESSMLDISLMHSLLKAIPPFARLILVGDVDQLPSVGPGNVLLDIIASGAMPVVRLQTVFRQAALSGIISNAHRINEGKFPAFNNNDFFLIEREEPATTVETILELVTKRIPNKFNLDPVRDIQVLAPMRRGEAGINRINEELQKALNPNGILVPKRLFRKGDKVMQLKNNYDLDVYNGDVGIISLVDSDANELEVTFEDGRAAIYRFDETDNLSLAYATTVHKSQGSEYPAVVLAFLPQHYMMLQRNLLYTAVTRGKKLVIIVGTGKAIGMAVHNNRISKRNTRLSERLRNELK